MKPLLVTSGEPAGIGPDICLALAGHPQPLVVLGDIELLRQRADQLNLSIQMESYRPGKANFGQAETLFVRHQPLYEPAQPNYLNKVNAGYVLDMLKVATKAILQGEFSALVTGPVHKGIINEAGFVFHGHTEYLASLCQVKQVVMMFAGLNMNLALVTTHLPLRAVADFITPELLKQTILTIHRGLQIDFGLKKPKMLIAGLNPHAGENGYLGREEIECIIPTLNVLKSQGIDVEGPFPADTLFRKSADIFIAMYHDQGLPVMKYVDFSNTVNVTLGLPFIRTSVDHGTALDLAGTGQALSTNLMAAVSKAVQLSQNRVFYDHH